MPAGMGGALRLWQAGRRAAAPPQIGLAAPPLRSRRRPRRHMNLFFDRFICRLGGAGRARCVVTYFYPIYFAVLLVHRAWRDDCFCSEKYGDDWRAYKQKVRAVFVPYLI
eukprot:gene5629-biopygen17799